MSQEVWELIRDHDFTEQDWQKVANSLRNVTLSPADREELVVIKIIYFQKGLFDRYAKQFNWAVRPK